MASSKPEFQGTVLQNGSLYCSLYKRSVINTSGTSATQYYWLPTNKSGDIIDFRVNILNGTFADASTADSNKPSGYGTYTDTWPTEKTLSYMYNFPFDGGDLNVFKQAVDDWIELGATNILIPIFWHDVFTTYAAQYANADISWTVKQDEVINYVKSKNVKVSLMIHMYLSTNHIPDFWGMTNREKDIFGDYVSLEYTNGHPSLAGSGADMMKDFYQKVLERYAHSSFLGPQLNWVTPVFTDQSEFGFNYDNGDSTIAHKTIYGYSTDSIAGFQIWLQTSAINPDYYANKDLLNAAWGTSFTSFSAVTPPSTPYSKGANEYQLSEVFASNWGKDFWKYLAYGQLAKFATDLRTITTTYAPSAKFVLSFGSNSPNDPLGGLRASYDIIKWGEVSDGLKTQFGINKRNDTMGLTLDFMQNYPGKKMAELHVIDYYEKGSLPVSVVKENMIASGEAAMRNGVKDLLFIGMTKQTIWFDMLKEIMRDLKPKMAQNYDNARQTGGRSTSVTLGALLSSPGGKVGLDNWIGVGGSNDSRVNYTFDNSIEQASSNFPYSMSLYDNQIYYMKQLDIKNSVYGRTETETGPYNTLQQSYNASRVPFLLSAFGITYNGTKTKSTIEIIDNNGVVWVKSVQNTGVTNTEQSGKYSNNHPEFRYIPNISEDCRFWLPIPGVGGYYDVKITVFDAPCRFDVYHADNTAPGGIAYNQSKTPTSAGSTETIRISLAQMSQASVNQRVIKINNNKWS